MTVETPPARQAPDLSQPCIHCEPIETPLAGPPFAIRAVLFDVDGVISDTADLHAAAWQRLADEEGLPFDNRIADAVRGISREQSLDMILAGKHTDRARRTAWMERKNHYYVAALERLSQGDILPGVATLIEDFLRLGIRIAAVSASRNARTVLDNLRLTDRFHVIVDGRDAAKRYRAANRYLLAASAIGVEPAECAVIEDSAVGIETARASGMRTVGVGTPGRLSRADLVFESLSGVRGAPLCRWLTPGH